MNKLKLMDTANDIKVKKNKIEITRVDAAHLQLERPAAYLPLSLQCE